MSPLNDFVKIIRTKKSGDLIRIELSSVPPYQSQKCEKEVFSFFYKILFLFCVLTLLFISFRCRKKRPLSNVDSPFVER